MPRKNDHLQLHGSQYRVRIAVPEGLRKQFGGKAFLIAPLGTGELSEADRRKGEHVSRFKRMIAQARETGDPVLKEARMFRRWEEERRAANPSDSADDTAADTQLAEISEIVAEEHGDAAGQTFYEVASGRSTPLADYLEEWIIDRAYIASSASHHRNAFAVLAAWCKSSRIKPTLEAIDSRTAWSFRDKCLRVRSSEPCFPSGTTARAAVSQIREKHAAIANYFESAHGLVFMRIESDILVASVLSLMKQGISALPNHDAVLVPERHAKVAKTTLERESERRVGTRIPADIKTLAG